jgi:PAS domain S-box-containing protein
MLSTQKKANILIVDDNPKNIQVAANVLKTMDLFNIFFATSGEAAISQLEKKEYCLILLDINMPGLNGYETADLIRKDPNTKYIPIIFLSADANQESINRGFEHGGQDYITKPFQQHELIHRVRTHVELFLAKKELQSEVDESHVLLEQYKEAIDISSLVSKTDVHGIITYANEPFCHVSQYSQEELLGNPHSIIRHPDTKDSFYKKMWDTITDKKVWKGIIKNRAKDGSVYFVDATIIPILNHHNEIIEYISVRTDITKQVQAKEQIISVQKEIIYTLGEMGEMRSKETGDHVNRVALYSALLARHYGLDDKEVEMLKMASPMHDIGKVAISDAILLKPGKLTDDEFIQMKEHASIGYEIFKKSSHRLLQMAAIISHEHHEKWNGTGYPRGLSGTDISICGRITAVADVFDALSNDRVYKKAWPLEEVIDFMKDESGKSFEPRLVDILLEHIDEILQIKQEHQK